MNLKEAFLLEKLIIFYNRDFSEGLEEDRIPLMLLTPTIYYNEDETLPYFRRSDEGILRVVNGSIGQSSVTDVGYLFRFLTKKGVK